MNCTCGYDLSHSPSVCPECGASVAQVRAAQDEKRAANFTVQRLRREQRGANNLIAALLACVLSFCLAVAPAYGWHFGLRMEICLAIAGLSCVLSGVVVAMQFRACVPAGLLVIAGGVTAAANVAFLSGVGFHLSQILIGLSLGAGPLGAGALVQWLHVQRAGAGNSRLPAVSRSPANLAYASAFVAFVYYAINGMAVTGVFILATIAAGTAAIYGIFRYKFFLHALVPRE